MTKDAAPAEVEVPKVHKKKGKLFIIIIAVVVLVLAAVSVAAVFFLTSKSSAQKKATSTQGEAADAEDGKHEDESPIYEKLDQLTVNLSDQQSYLQADVQLILADTKIQEKLKLHMPEVRDALIRLLSSKTAEELAQADGKAKLAEEVQKSVNDVLEVKKSSKGVKKVLFVNFIIQ